MWGAKVGMLYFGYNPYLLYSNTSAIPWFRVPDQIGVCMRIVLFADALWPISLHTRDQSPVYS